MEICDVNRFYGHSHIIKSYCNLPEHEPIPMAIQHGADRSYQQLLHEIFEEPLFDYWVYSARVKKNANRKFGVSLSNLHILGAPFAYLCRILNHQLSPVEARKGTIAFPDHSTPGKEIIGQYEDYANELSRLPNEFHPITVSVHPHDIQLNKHLTFLNHGFAVVTAGNSSPLQINFLHNFYHFCKDKRYATSNALNATPPTYVMYLGIPFFLTGRPSTYNTTSEKEAKYVTEEDHLHLEQFYNRFTFKALGDPDIQKEQLKYAYDDLGHDYLLQPKELLDYIIRIRNKQPYIDKILPIFQALSKQFEGALRPSGPMQPISIK